MCIYIYIYIRTMIAYNPNTINTNMYREAPRYTINDTDLVYEQERCVKTSHV